MRSEEEIAFEADPRWVLAEDDVLELHADVGAGLDWTLVVDAGLSGLQTTWEQGPVRPNEFGLLVVRVTAPDSAFLHDAALDYLTVLRPRLIGRAEGGGVYSLRVPNAFLAWPNGRAEGSVLWDRVRADSLAPNGIVSSSAREAAGELSLGEWVQPVIDGLAVVSE